MAADAVGAIRTLTPCVRSAHGCLRRGSDPRMAGRIRALAELRQCAEEVVAQVAAEVASAVACVAPRATLSIDIMTDQHV